MFGFGLFWRARSVLACIAFLYVIVLFLILSSPFFQSILVYLHFVKMPFTDFTHLEQFGLSGDVRNIEIMTNDMYVLRGYHMVPPGAEAAAAARYHGCNTGLQNHGDTLWTKEQEKDCDEFFDQSLFSSSRVIIYFHGNAGSRVFAPRLSLMRRLSSQLSAHVITVDYRSFGDSSNAPVVSSSDPTVESNYWDAAQQYVRQIRSLPILSPPTEHGTFVDSLAVLTWVQQRVNTTYNTPYTSESNYSPRIYFYGHSLGCAVATKLAAEIGLTQRTIGSSETFDVCAHTDEAVNTSTSMGRSGSSTSVRKKDCTLASDAAGDVTQQSVHSVSTLTDGGAQLTGVILDSPFTTFADAITSHYLGAVFRNSVLLKSLLDAQLTFKYNNSAAIVDISVPILLVHGTLDNVLPIHHSQRLFDIVQQHAGHTTSADSGFGHATGGIVPGRLWFARMVGAGHDTVHMFSNWIHIISDFVKEAEEKKLAG